VFQYLQQNVASTIPLEQCCRCRQKKRSKPNPSGREITAEPCLQVSTHEQEKENVPPRQGENLPPRQEKDKENVPLRATTARQGHDINRLLFHC